MEWHEIYISLSVYNISQNVIDLDTILWLGEQLNSEVQMFTSQVDFKTLQAKRWYFDNWQSYHLHI